MPHSNSNLWRAFTVKQPWAWAFCYADNNVENRRWPVPAKLLEPTCENCNGKGITGTSEFSYGECEQCGGEGDLIDEPLRVMIHAGKQWDANFEANWAHYRIPHVAGHMVGGRDLNNDYRHQPFSAVVAVATITGQHACGWAGGQGENPPFLACWIPTADDLDTDPDDHCSDWAHAPKHWDDDMWHWEIADVRPLPEPVPAKGRQRLWIPDADLVAAVEAQL